VTRDGRLNTADKGRVQTYISDKNQELINLGIVDEFTFLLTDMNGDEKINTADKGIIQQMVAGNVYN